ncbi:MAG: hypothetical protein M3081_00165 [Gemmatimonadota bacterium]|nr:hypothetical protein [Gemmatimonadota bacterium]
MQILVYALCSRGESLREAIANDSSLGKYGLEVVREKQPGRSPGWMKLRGADSTRGALNIEWDPQSAVLNARVVTRGSRRPSPIVGDFLNYLLARHRTRVQAVTTAYR